MPAPHSDLRPGATVYSADGHNVGSLEGVLVDHKTMELRHIVVKESAHTGGHHWYQGANALVHDVIVAPSISTASTYERVDLKVTLSEVRHLPPFPSYHYAGAVPRQMKHLASPRAF